MTSAQDGALNAATYGCGKYVFDMGNCFAAEILSNNCVRVKDGYALNQGRFMGMENGDYEDVVIDNGIKGLKRADLIVMRYSVNSDTGIETAEMMALKGEVGADYTDPDIITGDILAGAVKDDFLLYRVKIDDINLVAVEPLFETSEATMKLVSEIQKEMPTLKNPEYETPEEPAELVSGENLGTALGKLAAAVKLLLKHKVQQATDTILGHVKLSDSAAITEKGVYALDAVEKNASVSGTMANKIDALNSSLENNFNMARDVPLASGAIVKPCRTSETLTLLDDVNRLACKLSNVQNVMSLIFSVNTEKFPMVASTGHGRVVDIYVDYTASPYWKLVVKSTIDGKIYTNYINLSID